MGRTKRNPHEMHPENWGALIDASLQPRERGYLVRLRTGELVRFRAATLAGKRALLYGAHLDGHDGPELRMTIRQKSIEWSAAVRPNMN